MIISIFISMMLKSIILVCVACCIESFMTSMPLKLVKPSWKNNISNQTEPSPHWRGAWLPVNTINTMPTDIPFQIVLAGDKYVVWKNLQNEKDSTQGWSVMKDVCPHRLAPLSQGRIDPNSGCIECPYHGWQFQQKSGKCTLIPQSESGATGNIAAESLPVHITGDILWAYTPLPEGQASFYPALPETILPVLAESDKVTTLVRDLPYSFDFLVENFMDPGHVPFAHHSLQGTRSDGSPVAMSVLTDLQRNSTHCEVSFVDKVLGKVRHGILSFQPPCYYHFRLLNNATGEYEPSLISVVAPTVPGWCRVINIAMRVPPLAAKVVPKWLGHAFSNRFMDTDLWVHDAERVARGTTNMPLIVESTTAVEDKVADGADFLGAAMLANSSQLEPIPLSGGTSVARQESTLAQYKLMSRSDTGPKAWRLWWARHMSLSRVFGPAVQPAWVPLAQQYDRYECHTKYCTACQGALRNADEMKRVAPLLALASVSLAASSSVWVGLSGVAVYAIMNWAADRVLDAVKGPSPGDRVSAAQFKEK